MAQTLTHLPHVKNVSAGMNKWDQVNAAVFEVLFSLPEAIRPTFKDDEAILTEQVTEVSGLDALQKTVGANSQKFMGVDVSFLNPTLDNTYADIQMTLNLNLRNVTDNYVLKVFKAWANLGYDLSNGTRTLAADYISDNLRISEGNRDGTVWRSYVFHRVMLTGVTGLDALSGVNNDARQLQVSFRADYWEEELG